MHSKTSDWFLYEMQHWAEIGKPNVLCITLNRVNAGISKNIEIFILSASNSHHGKKLELFVLVE